MGEAYIIDAVRTPVGRRNGALSGVRADELAATTLSGCCCRLGSRGPHFDAAISRQQEPRYVLASIEGCDLLAGPCSSPTNLQPWTTPDRQLRPSAIAAAGLACRGLYCDVLSPNSQNLSCLRMPWR